MDGFIDTESTRTWENRSEKLHPGSWSQIQTETQLQSIFNPRKTGAILKCAVFCYLGLFAVRPRNDGEILEFSFVGLHLYAIPLGHDLIDFHEGFVLGLGDYEEDVNDGGQADATENQEAIRPKSLLHGKEGKN